MRTDHPAPQGRDPSDLLAASALSVIWAGVMVWLSWNRWGEDVIALYMAGHFFAAGQTDLIYAAPPAFFGGTPGAWDPAMQALGIGDKVAYPFVYPPLWAAVFAPVSEWIAPAAFCRAAAILQIPLIPLAVAMAGQMARPADWSRTQWTVLSLMIVTGLLPGIGAVNFIQPTITTAFLTVLSVWLVWRGHPVAAGTALAVAAAMKLSPAAFVLVFLIDRQWRAVAAFALAGALLAGTSLLLAGPDLHLAFREALRHATAFVFVVPGNFSLRLLLELFDALRSGDPGLVLSRGPQVTPATPWVDLLAGAAGFAAMATLAARLWHRAQAERLVLGLVGVGLIQPLFGPIGWMHYYMLPLFFAPALYRLLPHPAVWVPAALLLVMLLKPVFDAFKLPAGGATLYVTLVCLGWLVLLFLILRRPPDRQTG